LRYLVQTADEKHRRLIVALEAMKLGRGGIQRVAQITGVDRDTIARGMEDLKRRKVPKNRIRKPGGGRLRVEKKRPGGVAGAQGPDER
jgi:hypothetical protein